MSIRIPVPAESHRLEQSVPRSAAHPVYSVRSRLMADHPKLGLDSLSERADAPTPGLTHRYVDKALFWHWTPGHRCTAASVPAAMPSVWIPNQSKNSRSAREERWQSFLHCLATELEDVVISGGDAQTCSPSRFAKLAMHCLASITSDGCVLPPAKGPAVMPQNC